MLKCHIAAIGEKNRQVCPHQSVAKIACDFRWRSNSPRSAYKIARCVAGFKKNYSVYNNYDYTYVDYSAAIFFLFSRLTYILADFVLTHFPTLHLGGGNFLRPYFLTVAPLEAKLLGLLSRHSPRVGLYKRCFQLTHQTSSLWTNW